MRIKPLVALLFWILEFLQKQSASARARSAAKKAALEAKEATLQKLHDLEIKEFRIKQRKAEI